jgi:putative transposase
MARTEPWRVSDEFWEKVQPLIPPTPSHAKGGRTRMDDRQAFAAMIYVLRTGIQWNALPRQMGASSTVHDRYQEWERLGFFEQLWRAGLLEYEELEGIEWEWQAIDGAMTKAPLGRGASGKNPTDRAKMGTKRSMLTDGAGIPLAVAVEGANRHDSRLLVATLDGLVVARPAREAEKDSPEQHLCLDAAYDSDEVRQELEARSYEPHISAAEERKRAKAGSPAPWREGQALGSGANTFLAEPLSAAVGALGKEDRELPGFHSSCLRPAHLLQDIGFRIRT